MFIIVQILFSLKAIFLSNSSGRIIINSNLVPPLYRNPLLFIIYIDMKQGLNCLLLILLQAVVGYHIKIKLAA